MASTRETSESISIVDSMTEVEFDADRGIYRATYDNDCDSTSMAVVAVIAAANRIDPSELDTLQSVVDTDALDALFSGSPTGVQSVSFRYEGFDVTVFGEGRIEADPGETE